MMCILITGRSLQQALQLPNAYIQNNNQSDSMGIENSVSSLAIQLAEGQWLCIECHIPER